ncbi:MAG: hypothetical protein H7Z72_08210 [Bacteroidetes bacterium]|nr:hypothetical protein [Fibrella sp.]
MRRSLSIGLLALLLCYSLGHALIYWSVVSQEQHDLSARLTMFWTVDSMVEFHLPLHGQPEDLDFTKENVPGFSYKGKSYEVIRMDVRRDTLFIVGYENHQRSFWKDDLLAFVKKEITGSSDTHQKTSQLLKLLLKEYMSTHPLCFGPVTDLLAGPDYNNYTAVYPQRPVPVQSPPPESAI